MIKPPLELSRPIEVSRIPPTGSTESIVADAAECALIAGRLGLPAIHSLTADLFLSRWRGQGVKATGALRAVVEQICVVSLDQFRAEISDTIERYFMPDDGKADEEADIDLFEDGVVELGEVVVESLSLALDPYPRKPGTVFRDVSDESRADTHEARPSPFAALARLRAPKR